MKIATRATRNNMSSNSAILMKVWSGYTKQIQCFKQHQSKRNPLSSRGSLLLPANSTKERTSTPASQILMRAHLSHRQAYKTHLESRFKAWLKRLTPARHGTKNSSKARDNKEFRSAVKILLRKYVTYLRFASWIFTNDLKTDCKHKS